MHCHRNAPMLENKIFCSKFWVGWFCAMRNVLQFCVVAGCSFFDCSLFEKPFISEYGRTKANISKNSGDVLDFVRKMS